VAPWALAEKGPEVRLNGFGSNRFRGDRLMCGGTPPLRLLGHEADRPYPAGELARRGDVLPWTPRASSASRLSASLRTPLAACLRATRSGAWTLARSFGRPEHVR